MCSLSPDRHVSGGEEGGASAEVLLLQEAPEGEGGADVRRDLCGRTSARSLWCRCWEEEEEQEEEEQEE